MNLVFNELSAIDLSVSEPAAVLIMEKFVRCFIAAIASANRFSRSIETCVDLNTIALSSTMPIARWRNMADRDLSSRFKSMCDRQTIKCMAADDLELTFHGRSGKGLLCAHQNGDVCISLGTADIWVDFKLNASVYDLSDNSSATVEIYNMYDEEQLLLYKNELRSMEYGEIASIHSGSELCAKVEQLFPNLVFHMAAKNQLNRQVESQHVPAIAKKLYEINEYFTNWEVGPFEPQKFKTKITPQSQATLTQYQDEHTFVFDGKRILVSYHLRYTGNIPGRIYFYPDAETRKGLICSLTTKLRSIQE